MFSEVTKRLLAASGYLFCFVCLRQRQQPIIITKNEHNAREAERRAHHDAFGADRGAPWRNPTDGGG